MVTVDNRTALFIMLFTFVAWVIFTIIALLIISLRPDGETILKELTKKCTRIFPFSILNMVVIFLMLPFSIPFSISYIRETKADKKNAKH